ncbi:GNAT family N-acetyltransferase [Gallaecimonas mangrovi]|uniref:GNAT family N-acetyltransferase n=1 Tax=Gallaecimonas mangrovi TaxID=2291597 RepID=UPI000E202193|nr:GNAT family N-acetyltransferase [Gallaecimonas mangrovi]
MIREAQLSDHPTILALWSEVANQLNPTLVTNDWQRFAHWLQQSLLPASEVYVYDVRSIRGFVVLKSDKLSALAVSPMMQKTGIGRALLYYCISRHPDLEVQLLSDAGAATGFFKHLGYHPVKEVLDSESGVNQLLMVSGKSRRYFSW